MCKKYKQLNNYQINNHNYSEPCCFFATLFLKYSSIWEHIQKRGCYRTNWKCWVKPGNFCDDPHFSPDCLRRHPLNKVWRKQPVVAILDAIQPTLGTKKIIHTLVWLQYGYGSCLMSYKYNQPRKLIIQK